MPEITQAACYVHAVAQLGLFTGGERIAIDAGFGAVERIALDRGAWLEVQRGWCRGHGALLAALEAAVPWKEESRVMYERRVEVPRLWSELEPSHHPVLAEMRGALDARYGTSFERMSAALYRDGRDSVAWHGDHVARRMPEALVATVSLGEPRRFLLRETGGGPSRALSLGWGDLLVMGGTCQRTYQHAIPKVARAAPRMAVMFRPVWEDSARA